MTESFGQFRSCRGGASKDEARCGVRPVPSRRGFRGQITEDAVEVVFAGHSPALVAKSGLKTGYGTA